MISHDGHREYIVIDTDAGPTVIEVDEGVLWDDLDDETGGES
jgi:hypothetical protein